MAQLPELPRENFIFEPVMRDVGPAIGLASFILEKKFHDEPIAIIWSDHLVKKVDAFQKALRAAEKLVQARTASFIFIGQKPRFANQNVGWIHLGDKEAVADDIATYHLQSFHYRPQLSQAEDFYASGDYVWNLGYFVTTPTCLVSLYKTHAPDMYQQLKLIQKDFATPQSEHTLAAIYPTLEKISFDDAILVKLKPAGLRVITADLGWSDVGAWDALKEALTQSKEENITLGNVILKNTKDTLLFNYSDKLCVGIGIDETIVINTEDVLLICPKHLVPEIKKLVETLTHTPHEHLV